MTELVDGFWTRLRAATPARVGLGRAGHGLPTSTHLMLAEAHAAARDAVHAPLDLTALAAELSTVGCAPAQYITSRARSREEYLRRPDLGATPAVLGAVTRSEADIGLLLADGLSPAAVAHHGPAMVAALLDALPGRSFAPPVIATQARVALGDHVAAAQGVETVIVLIGERPGLSVTASLGLYLTHRPAVGLPDSRRNCVSNVHPPDGLDYAAAAFVVAGLVAGARRLGTSGVLLKESGDIPAGLTPGAAQGPDRATVSGGAAVENGDPPARAGPPGGASRN